MFVSAFSGPVRGCSFNSAVGMFHFHSRENNICSCVPVLCIQVPRFAVGQQVQMLKCRMTLRALMTFEGGWQSRMDKVSTTFILEWYAVVLHHCTARSLFVHAILSQGRGTKSCTHYFDDKITLALYSDKLCPQDSIL